MALVARELCYLPKFSLMRSLFRAGGAGWIAGDHRTGPLPAESSGDRPGVDTNHSAEVICRQIVAAMLQTAPQQTAPTYLQNR